MIYIYINWGGMGWKRCVSSCEHMHANVHVGSGKELFMDALFSAGCP